jgi:hypothetical protein
MTRLTTTTALKFLLPRKAPPWTTIQNTPELSLIHIKYHYPSITPFANQTPTIFQNTFINPPKSTIPISSNTNMPLPQFNTYSELKITRFLPQHLCIIRSSRHPPTPSHAILLRNNIPPITLIFSSIKLSWNSDAIPYQLPCRKLTKKTLIHVETPSSIRTSHLTIQRNIKPTTQHNVKPTTQLDAKTPPIIKALTTQIITQLNEHGTPGLTKEHGTNSITDIITDIETSVNNIGAGVKNITSIRRTRGNTSNKTHPSPFRTHQSPISYFSAQSFSTNPRNKAITPNNKFPIPTSQSFHPTSQPQSSRPISSQFTMALKTPEDEREETQPTTNPPSKQSISTSSKSPTNNTTTIDSFFVSPISNQVSQTVNLSEITDSAIRLQIEQLLQSTNIRKLSPIAPFSPPTPQTQSPHVSYATATQSPHVSYATATTGDSNSMQERDSNSMQGLQSQTNLDQDSEDSIDDNNLFTIIAHKKKKTETSTHHTHFKQGISNVLSASAEVWNDHETIRILNQDNLHNQHRRLAEGRVKSVHEVTRPSIWVKYSFPTVIASIAVAPNILQQELAIDYMLSLAQLHFQVDRLYVGTILQPCTFDNVQCFLGFIAISPSMSLNYGDSNTVNKETIKLLYTLENRLYCLFQDTSLYQTQSNETTPHLTPHMAFKLPHVNHHSEEITWLISGLPPQLPHNDVASLRELGTDIFRSIITAFKAIPANNKRPKPDVFFRQQSRFHMNQIISVRPWTTSFTPQTQNNQRGRGRGRTIPSGRTMHSHPISERLLAIVTNTSHTDAIELINITNDICEFGTIPISICGGKLDVNLIPYHTMPKPNTTHFHSIISPIKTANAANYAKNKVRIIRDIRIHPHTINNPEHINQMVQNTPTCRAIIVNLQYGRTDPALTCLLEHSTDSTINSPQDLLQALSNTIPNFNISPTQQQREAHPDMTQLSPTKPRLDTYIGHSLPSIVSTNSSTHRYHALVNPAGGISMAGIYKGHYDINNFRQISEQVSYPFGKSFATEYEAMRYFSSFYPHCTTRAHTLFMNYNAPTEASNMNNPSQRIRELIGKPTTNPHERTFFFPNLIENFIVLSRQAASQRMRDQGLNPSDSYDFLPAEYPRTYHSPADLPIDLSPEANSNTPITHNNINSPHPLFATTTQQDDDIMSQLSAHTHSHLSIQQPLETNEYMTPKRPRTSNRSISTLDHHATLTQVPTPTIIALINPITTTKEHILTEIMVNSTAYNIPPLTISQTIHFAPTPVNQNTKITYITILQPEHTHKLIQLLQTLSPTCNPRAVHTLPPFITTPQTLDTTPPMMGELPTNCRVTQCPLYNNGFEQPPPNNNTQIVLHELYQHGIGIHNDLFQNTDVETLATIGWFRCNTNCNQYFFGNNMTNDHRQQCNIYAATQIQDTIIIDNSQDNTEDSTTSEDLLQSQNIELSQTSLFDSCPTNRHQDLQVLINLNTTPASINAKILRWHAEASNVDTNSYDDL